MTEDRAVREALGSYPDAEPPMNLTVDTVLTAGRRRRTLRQAAVTAFSGVTVAAVAFGIYAGQPASEPPFGAPDAPALGVHDDPNRQLHNPVAALIQARVRTALPTVPLTLDQIYPSDWNHDVALPAEQAANATDWQALYTVGTKEHQFWVGVFLSPPSPKPIEAELHNRCQRLGGPTKCSYVISPDGSILFRQIRTTGNGIWVRVVNHRRPGDREVTVQERVPAASLADALKKWTIPVSKLDQLATDLKLVIPDPQVRPPLPTTS